MLSPKPPDVFRPIPFPPTHCHQCNAAALPLDYANVYIGEYACGHRRRKISHQPGYLWYIATKCPSPADTPYTERHTETC